ncbi:hypothetical protein F2Q70_00003395 [Brassica cretica]|uniref:Uncharacterized protein n=1 Tax=Brassica cretica TaxID=69181 RepID=A0A8S9IM54_BRACR|nr:hypothetical protein F2Q70_00003395 [Brassica cretica]
MNPSPPPIQASSSSSFPSVTLFQKIFLTEGIHSVSEASRSINGREFICLYEKDSAEIVVKQSKRSHLFLKMIVLGFAMVCGLYICSVYLNQFSVQTSQLVRTRITTRIQYPKPETFNRDQEAVGGSSSNNRKPRCYRELASLFVKIAAAEVKRFKRNPRTDLSKALKTNRGGESVGFNTKPLIKPLQVGRRIEKVTLAVARREAMNFVFSLQSY